MGHDGALVRTRSTPGSHSGHVRAVNRPGGSVSAAELVITFLSGIGMGIALDRWLLPPLVDAWIDHVHRHGR
jgi:hypothetical protein